MPDSFTVTTTGSFGSRLANSFLGLVVGPIFIILAIALLWWNEGRAIRAIVGLNEAAGHVTEAQASGPSPTNNNKLVHVVGTATAQSPIQDKEVGITFTGQVNVSRTAEMYQWKEDKETEQGGGTTYDYSLVWSDLPIDSSKFDYPGNHENPKEMPFRSSRWSADDAKLGGWKLNADTLDRIAQAEVLKPDAPAGWTRSGDDYYRGDPAAPEIGDLRVRYEGLPSGATISVLAQQSGHSFVVFTTTSGYEVLAAAIGDHSAAELIERQRASEALTTWALRGMGTVLMFVGFVAFLAPLSNMANLVPMLAAFVRGAIGIASLALALPLSILVIALAWLAYRPLIAAGLFLLAVAAGYALWGWREKRRSQQPAETGLELESPYSADRGQIAPSVRMIDIATPGWWFERGQSVETYGRTKDEIENGVREFARNLAGNKAPPGSWRRLFSPTEIVSARAPLKGKLAFHGGGALLVLGFGLFAAISFYPPEQHATWLFWAAVAGGLALFTAGGFIRNRGKHLLQPTASEVQAQDTRRPIVLLRSFPDDALTVVTGQSKDKLETGDFEESIADQFTPFGPFVAIGKPGEALPTLGAARNYYSDTEWQDAVGKWMDEALIIVVVAGVTAGLRWELDTIRNSGHLDKLLVLMPPMTLQDGQHVYRWGGGWTSRAQESKEGETRWDTVRSAFAGIDAFDQLPEDRPAGLIAMHLGQDGKLVLLIGPETAWEQDYERAIRYAFYGMYIHGPRSVLPQVPSKIHAGMGI